MPKKTVRYPKKLIQDVDELLPTSEYKNFSDLNRSLLRWWVSSRKTDRGIRV